MDEKKLKIEKLKANMERHKAYIIYWQTLILSKKDCSSMAYHSLHNHVELVDQIAALILEE